MNGYEFRAGDRLLRPCNGDGYVVVTFSDKDDGTLYAEDHAVSFNGNDGATFASAVRFMDTDGLVAIMPHSADGPVAGTDIIRIGGVAFLMKSLVRMAHAVPGTRFYVSIGNDGVAALRSEDPCSSK